MNVKAFRCMHRRLAALFIATIALYFASAHVAAMPMAWTVGAGGTILVSTDLGATWTPQTSGTSQDLRGVDFFDATYGVAVGAGGTLLRTTNAGVTWTPRPSGVGATLYDVVLSGPNTGVALGDGGNVIRTLDGGATWSAPVHAAQRWARRRERI